MDRAMETPVAQGARKASAVQEKVCSVGIKRTVIPSEED